MNQPNQIIIVLSTALPCGTLKPTEANPEARCGQPATVAHAVAAPEDNPNLPTQTWPRPGEWVLLPVCGDCALATAKNYGLVKE